MSKPEPYRPSNGTEGIDFHENWCTVCQRERAYMDDPDSHEKACKIFSLSLIHNVDDQAYPRELIYSQSGPVCTAYRPYVDEGWPWAMIPDHAQMELPL